MHPDSESFEAEKRSHIANLGGDAQAQRLALEFMRETAKHNYTYNFTWLGVPVIQFPQDLVAMQEIIWQVKPDLIVETGVAHGGGLIFYASMLELLGQSPESIAVGIELELRPNNQKRIEAHPLARRLKILNGSSLDPAVIDEVRDLARGKTVLVVLDSDHTHDHVLAELRAYSEFVNRGSYIVVFDTSIEDLPDGFFQDRPWSKANNPKTAVRAFLKENDRFAVDQDIENKLLITVAREGYLRCVKDRVDNLAAKS